MTEVEDRVWEKEEVVDRLWNEYNQLLEKHLKTPKKVTTTSTTVKTIVDQDPVALPAPPKFEGIWDWEVQATEGHKPGEPRKEDIAWIAELQEEVWALQW